MNKKLLALTLGVIVVSVLVWSYSRQNTEAHLTIGFIGPLSGEAAGFGITEKNATEIALSEIGSSIKVIYEDGKCSGKDALSAFEKLTTIDGVNVVLGGTCSAETLAIAPVAEKKNVLLLSAFSSNPGITDSGDYIFRNAPSDSLAARVDAETIVKDGYKKVAIVSENTEYSLGVRTILKELLLHNNVEVVSDELYDGSGVPVTDFRSIFLKVSTAKPDMLYLNPGSSAQVGGLMVKQARELGLELPIHGNFSLGTPEALSIGGELMEGVVVGDGTGLSEKGKVVLQKYRERFGEDPANEYEMGAAYDRVLFIRDAVLAVGSDPEDIKEYLYSIDNFSGALGDYHFDKNGDIVGVGFTNVIIKNGEKVPYLGRAN